jgi:hypothetical protein
MFLLIDQSTGGVYAVRDSNNEKVVQMFEDKDDADRYVGLLLANSNSEEYVDLEVVDIDEDTVVQNCEIFGYNYCRITPDDIVFPP